MTMLKIEINKTALSLTECFGGLLAFSSLLPGFAGASFESFATPWTPLRQPWINNFAIIVLDAMKFNVVRELRLCSVITLINPTTGLTDHHDSTVFWKRTIVLNTFCWKIGFWCINDGKTDVWFLWWSYESMKALFRIEFAFHNWIWHSEIKYFMYKRFLTKTSYLPIKVVCTDNSRVIQEVTM